MNKVAAESRISTGTPWATRLGRVAEDFFWKSRITQPFLVSAFSVGALFLLVSNPVGWMIAAVAAGAFFLSVIVQMVADKGPKKLLAELSAIKWSLLSEDRRCSRIDITYGPQNAKFSVYLMAAPNQRNFDVEKTCDRSVKETGRAITCMITVQELWERREIAWTTAPTEEELTELGIEQTIVEVPDHHYPSSEQLDQIATDIKNAFDKGDNVTIHCKAGQGRSAMGVAAFLIKYCDREAQEARDMILAYRPNATIAKKLEDKKEEKGLISYEGYCRS